MSGLTNALRPESLLRARVRTGKQALERADRERVVDGDEHRVEESLNLDDALRRWDPQGARWDYWIAVAGPAARLEGIEVHPATPSEVRRLIEKRNWALRWAGSHLTRDVSAWIWVASGKVGIAKTSSAYRRLRLSGIRLVGRRYKLT